MAANNKKGVSAQFSSQIFVVNTKQPPAAASSINLNGNKSNKWLTNVTKNQKNDNNIIVNDNNVHVISFKNNSENQSECLNENDCDSDVISNYIGHYGRWQFFWTFLLALFQLPTTFEIFALVFQASDQNYWCARPDYMEDITDDEWRLNAKQCHYNSSLLNTYAYVTSIDNNPISALRYTSNDNNDDTLSSMIKCDKFEFDFSYFGETIVSQWNLVCDRYNMQSVVEMCFLAGAAVGSLCSGWVSDKYGRRHTLMVLSAIQNIIGTLAAFSTSLPMFMILRFIIGFASMGVTMVSFVLAVELVSGKWRTIIGILVLLPVAISYILMAGIAFIWRDWQQIQLIISVPWLSLLILWIFLPESPRWLLENGRIDELCKLIEKAAKWNGTRLSMNYEKNLHKPDEIATVSFVNLFKSKYVRNTLLVMVIWYSMVLMYFGLTLHMNNLGGNIYTNTVIAGSVEAISVTVCILVVLKMGIKNNLIAYMFVAGCACLFVNIVPDDAPAGVISLAMIAKFTIGATNALLPTYTARQYPTTMRTLAIGIGNLAAGFALITVPYLWLLEDIEKNIPMTIMGGFAILGGISIFFMQQNDNE